MNKIRIFTVKVITAVMGVIFLCCMCAGDDTPLKILIPLMLVSGSWLYLVAYANGWIMETEPWYQRQEREEHDMH